MHDLEAFDGFTLRQDFLEKLAQLRDVPLIVAQFVDERADRLTRLNSEIAIEVAIGVFDAQVPVEYDEWLAQVVDNILSVIAGGGDGSLALLELIDLQQQQHHAVDRVVERHGGSQAQQVPMPVFVQDFVFLLAHGGDDFGTECFQIQRCFHVVRENEVVLDVADRPPHVGGHQMELLCPLRAETPDGQVSPKQQHGQPR